MFHYTQYRCTQIKLIREFVERFPLALITSFVDGHWHSSHIPLFLNEHNNELFGHVDASNSQFAITDDLPVQIVFVGPNIYIPPEAYATRQLPTWNYLSVHATGTLSIVNNSERNFEILRETALRLKEAPSAFRVEDSDHRVQKWIGSIRGLCIRMNDIEGRFKLSQDKSIEDVAAAAQYFSDALSRKITPDLLLLFSGVDSHSTKGHLL